MSGQQGVEALVAALIDVDTRENALLDLSKKRDMFADLAPILWHSFGVIPALLQEIVSIYPLLSPPSLTAHASNRVCNALALLQCVASHPDTRALFLNGAAAARAAVAAVASTLALAPCRSQFQYADAAPRARSTHPAVSVPVSEHRQQDAALRVPPTHQSGRHRRPG